MIYNYVIYMYINILLLSACDAGSMVTSICWNDGANMLAAMQDGNFVVWYHPGIVHLDRDLLPITVLTKEGRYMYIYILIHYYLGILIVGESVILVYIIVTF